MRVHLTKHQRNRIQSLRQTNDAKRFFFLALTFKFLLRSGLYGEMN